MRVPIDLLDILLAEMGEHFHNRDETFHYLGDFINSHNRSPENQQALHYINNDGGPHDLIGRCLQDIVQILFDLLHQALEAGSQIVLKKHHGLLRICQGSQVVYENSLSDLKQLQRQIHLIEYQTLGGSPIYLKYIRRPISIFEIDVLIEDGFLEEGVILDEKEAVVRGLKSGDSVIEEAGCSVVWRQ